MDFNYRCPYCDQALRGTIEKRNVVTIMESWCDHCDSKLMVKIDVTPSIRTIKLDESER
jgi:DNA-directed RNA polymerase subunit RPC12/RpoP